MNAGTFIRQSVRLATVAGIAGSLLLILLCIFLLSTAQAQADGNFLRVPDDYPTIQAAIDAAQAGAEIRIVGNPFPEILSITKAVTLSGGWETDFSKLSPFYTRLNAQGIGRAITISGTADVSVVISRFLVLNGDATGLGGVEIGSVTGTPAGAAAAADNGAARPIPSPGDLSANVESHLRSLAARAQLPGAQADLPQSLARLDRLTALAGGTPALTGRAATGVADCGGAIYVRGASLRLIGSVIGQPDEPNIASRTGLGAGGALCAVDIPAGGLQLDTVKIEHNIASDGGAGLGGGVFISSTSAGAVYLHNFEIYNNLAGRGGDGYGGGIMLWNAPGAILEMGALQYNLASAAGTNGYGGGIALVNSPQTRLTQLEVAANSANTTWPPNQRQLVFGFGGGVSVIDSDDVTVEGDMIFDQNLAAVHGQGAGGGLYVRGGQGLHVDDALFTANWSVLYPYQFQGGQSSGGGIALELSDGARVTASNLAENQVALYNGYCQDVYGGALAGIGLNDFQLAASQIVENVAGACDGGPRPVAHGAVSLISGPQAITITGNSFAGNVAELGDQAGLGGALYMNDAVNVLIQQNQFLSNTSGIGGGVGGAVVVEGARSVSFDGNRMIGNRAADSADAEVAIGGALGINGTTDLQLVNNVLAGNMANQGAALLLVGGTMPPTSTVTVANNTLYANAGASGIILRQWTTPITLTNNLVVSHTLGIEVESGAAALRYTLYDGNSGNAGGAGTIDESHAISGAAAFVDAAGHDWRLMPSSAAIDAGDPAGVPPAPPEDIDRNARPFGPRVDIGAYEWQGPRMFLPLIAHEVSAPFGAGVWSAEGGAMRQFTPGDGTRAQDAAFQPMGAVNASRMHTEMRTVTVAGTQ